MSRHPARKRPSGQQLPPLRPNMEPIRIGGASPSISVAPESGTPVTPKSSDTGVPQSPPQPRYQQFERRDARLRPEQWREIEDLAARIKRSRQDKRERITASTLLRLATDLLLARQDELTGETERDLRASLGLPDVDDPT